MTAYQNSMKMLEALAFPAVLPIARLQAQALPCSLKVLAIEWAEKRVRVNAVGPAHRRHRDDPA